MKVRQAFAAAFLATVMFAPKAHAALHAHRSVNPAGLAGRASRSKLAKKSPIASKNSKSLEDGIIEPEMTCSNLAECCLNGTFDSEGVCSGDLNCILGGGFVGACTGWCWYVDYLTANGVTGAANNGTIGNQVCDYGWDAPDDLDIFEVTNAGLLPANNPFCCTHRPQLDETADDTDLPWWLLDGGDCDAEQCLMPLNPSAPPTYLLQMKMTDVYGDGWNSGGSIENFVTFTQGSKNYNVHLPDGDSGIMYLDGTYGFQPGEINIQFTNGGLGSPSWADEIGLTLSGKDDVAIVDVPSGTYHTLDTNEYTVCATAEGTLTLGSCAIEPPPTNPGGGGATEAGGGIVISGNSFSQSTTGILLSVAGD